MQCQIDNSRGQEQPLTHILKCNKHLATLYKKTFHTTSPLINEKAAVKGQIWRNVMCLKKTNKNIREQLKSQKHLYTLRQLKKTRSHCNINLFPEQYGKHLYLQSDKLLVETGQKITRIKYQKIYNKNNTIIVKKLSVIFAKHFLSVFL